MCNILDNVVFVQPLRLCSQSGTTTYQQMGHFSQAQQVVCYYFILFFWFCLFVLSTVITDGGYGT